VQQARAGLAARGSLCFAQTDNKAASLPIPLLPRSAREVPVWQQMSGSGRVSRASPVQTATRNCTRDEGGPFGFGNQVLIPADSPAGSIKIPAGFFVHGLRFRRAAPSLLMNRAGFCGGFGLQYGQGSYGGSFAPNLTGLISTFWSVPKQCSQTVLSSVILTSANQPVIGCAEKSQAS
jgi:hypothetical protein